MLATFRRFFIPALNFKKHVFFKNSSTIGFPKEQKIKVGHCDINYLKVGGAHYVLCYPGTLGTIWTDFKPQVEGFDRDKFTLVAWDPPGYGKSRPPEKEYPALQISNYSIIGWSGGGISSLILAAKYPSVVNKLVVWGSNSYILPHELEGYYKIKDINSWSKKMREPMIETYGEETFAKLWAQWVEGMHNIYKENSGDICSEIIADIKCPTFILHGKRDPIIDAAHVSHLLKHIAKSRVHFYPEGKHNIHVNYDQDFNQRVQEFLLQP